MKMMAIGLLMVTMVVVTVVPMAMALARWMVMVMVMAAMTMSTVRAMLMVVVVAMVLVMVMVMVMMAMLMMMLMNCQRAHRASEQLKGFNRKQNSQTQLSPRPIPARNDATPLVPNFPCAQLCRSNPAQTPPNNGPPWLQGTAPTKDSSLQ